MVIENTVIIETPKAKNRLDSFWYYGKTIASIKVDGRTFLAAACGLINVQFKEGGEIYSNEKAVEYATEKGYTDRKLNNLNRHHGWGNNNWFSIFEIDAEGNVIGHDDLYTCGSYDEAINSLQNVKLLMRD